LCLRAKLSRSTSGGSEKGIIGPDAGDESILLWLAKCCLEKTKEKSFLFSDLGNHLYFTSITGLYCRIRGFEFCVYGELAGFLVFLGSLFGSPIILVGDSTDTDMTTKAFLVFLVFSRVLGVYAKLSWNLEGKNACVTGGTKGIGRAVVEELAELGCGKIVTCSRSSEDLEQASREWQSRGFKNIRTVVADVSTAEGREALLAACRDEFAGRGGMQCLVNNVGSNVRKSAVDYSMDDYRKVMSTNIESCFFTCLGAHDLLAEGAKDSGTSSVVNVGSVAGGCGSSMKSGAIYAMTKAAMCQLSYNLACEWAPRRIRVNTVSPWYIATPLAEQVLKQPEYLAKVLSRTPMGRVGTVAEVAAAVAFLLMDGSSFITGQNLPVDGGYLRSGFY